MYIRTDGNGVSGNGRFFYDLGKRIIGIMLSRAGELQNNRSCSASK